MAQIKIAVINASEVVSMDEAARVVQALQKQIRRDFAPVWGVDADLRLWPGDVTPPPGVWWLLILDDADMANSLGYHDVTFEGLPLSKTFARTAKMFQKEWSASASHELLEMLIDPSLNLTALHQTPFDVEQNSVGRLYSYEVCDPCQSQKHAYEIDGVLVSDFVYPSWFESFHKKSAGIRFDHMGAIEAPFQVLPGGFTGVYDMTSGTGWQQVGLAAEADMDDFRAAVGTRRERRRTNHALWMPSNPKLPPAAAGEAADGGDMATEKPYWQQHDDGGSELSGTPEDPASSDIWDGGIDSGPPDSSRENQFSRGRWNETDPAAEGGSDPFTAESEEAVVFEAPDQPESWSPAGSSDILAEEERDNMPPKSDATNSSNNLPNFWAADPRENSFYRFAEGVGRVRPDGKGLSLAMNVYDSDGNPDGQQICNGEVTANSLDDLLKPPANPNVRFSNTGRIAEVPVTTRCQATWRFRDGSTLTAIGKGTSHIVPLSPNIVSAAFGARVLKGGVMKDAAIMVVTHGTGQYAGARGHVTLDSSVMLPDLNNVPFGKPGAVIHQKSLHTFRVYKGRDVRP